MGHAGLEAILAHRRAHPRVRSLYTLCEEIDTRHLNRRVIENLIKAGALDGIGRPENGGATSPSRRRAQLTAIIERALEHGARMQRDRERGQTHLFDTDGNGNGNGNGGRSDDHLPDVPAWTDAETLHHEKEALGLYLTGHPMDGFRRRVGAMNARTIDAIGEHRGPVTVAGMVSDVKPRTTKKGDQMATAVLEDRTGRIDLVIFPHVYRLAAGRLKAETGVVVTGKTEQDEERMRLLVDDVTPIEHIAERADRTMRIRLGRDRQDRATLEALAGIMKIHRGPTPVEIQLLLDDRTPPIRGTWTLKNERVRVSEPLLQEIESLCGKGSASWIAPEPARADQGGRGAGGRLARNDAARGRRRGPAADRREG